MNTVKELLEEELALVENYIQFLDRRRTGGILYIPEELTFPEGGGYDDNEETFEQVLMDYMVEAVKDRQSAASIVPIILRGPAEFHDQIRHIDLDGDFYATLCARAYKIKAQIDELDTD